MKLTNWDRNAFVNAVMQDVPEVYNKAVHEEIQKALVKAMSPACRNFYKKCPNALRRKVAYDITAHGGVSFIVGDANLDDVVKPWVELHGKRCKMRNDLHLAIKSCSTLKQAKERFPELAKYLPQDRDSTGVKNLPALANLTDGLKELGWPKAA